MARSYYEGGQGDLVKWFQGKLRNIEDGSAKALEQAVEDGKNTMKEMISQRGTGRVWSRPGPTGRDRSAPGRVDTGHMRDSVDSYFNVTSKGNAVGRFGWIKSREDYFGLQEGGFEHPSGITVEGMYAMVDAGELAWSEFQRRVEEEIKNA